MPDAATPTKASADTTVRAKRVLPWTMVKTSSANTNEPVWRLWHTRRLMLMVVWSVRGQLTYRGENATMFSIVQTIAQELGVREAQVQAAVDLLDGGATVPFVARYRKEATGGLDDVALRALDSRLTYLRELHDRREVILGAINEQGKLTPALRQALAGALTKQELEDLYLPFKQKRRTKGEMAREAGLEPLADRLLADPTLIPIAQAQAFVIPTVALAEGADKQPDFSTVQLVLDGVRDILSERWAEQSVLVQSLRAWLWDNGELKSSLRSGKDENHADIAKFRDYFDYQEPIAKVPSHRALAVFRGRAQEVLDVQLALPQAASAPTTGSTSANPLAEAGSPSSRAGVTKAVVPMISWPGVSAGPGGSSSACRPNAIFSRGCAKRLKRRQSRCLPTTCVTCCWQRRPAHVWYWVLIRASVPVSRSRWWTAMASWSRPPPYTRTNRARTGTAPCTSCASCACAMASA